MMVWVMFVLNVACIPVGIVAGAAWWAVASNALVAALLFYTGAISGRR